MWIVTQLILCLTTAGARAPAAAGAAAGAAPAAAGGLGLPGALGLLGSPLGLGGAVPPTNELPLLHQLVLLLEVALGLPGVPAQLQEALGNAEIVQRAVRGNAWLQARADEAPNLAALVRDTAYLQRIGTLEHLRAALEQQQQQGNELRQRMAMANAMMAAMAGGAGAGTTGGAGLGNMDSMMRMLMDPSARNQGLGGGPPPNVPPEEFYARQLEQMRDMGFFNQEENIAALRAAGGNVNAAIERLLGG